MTDIEIASKEILDSLDPRFWLKPPATRQVYADYLRCMYTPAELQTITNRVARALFTFRASDGELPAVAYRGTSGAAIAWPLSYETGCQLVRVGKDSEKRHGTRLEGVYNPSPDVKPLRVVWVDDFIATGRTLHAVVQGLEAYQRLMTGKSTGFELVGVILYHPTSGTADDTSDILRYVLEEFPRSVADDVHVITARDDYMVHVGKTPGDMYEDEMNRQYNKRYMPGRPTWLFDGSPEDCDDEVECPL